MKPIQIVLVVGSIVCLFVAWNYKVFFKRANYNKIKAVHNMTKNSAGGIKKEEAKEEEELFTKLMVSEILSLNRAAHSLTRSGSLLDKLLKKDKQEACIILTRDYSLSSVLVVIKHEEHVVQEGFKNMIEIKKRAGSKDSDSVKEMSISKPKEMSLTSAPHPHEHDPTQDDNHHGTSDPLRIALYCKDLLRPPRVGRVIRMVQSESDKNDKYIIELVK